MATPVNVLPLSPDEQARFWARVDQSAADECWPWKGRKNLRGYGNCTIKRNGRRRYVAAHRIAWALHTGSELGELLCCHRCDNPPCCNPDHLFAGTQRDNVQDCIAKGRLRRRHCKRGHELSPENLRVRANGVRLCRICDNRRGRENMARRAAAKKSQALRRTYP